MKKMLMGLLFVSGIASAACRGPFCNDDKVGAYIDNASLALQQKTLAQLNAIAPAQVGQMLMCSDCTRSAVCVSSGTATGAWVVLVASGTFVGATWSGIQHCQ